MADETKLKPCPCCGVDLIGGARNNSDGAGSFFYYHPHNHCVLQNVGVWPHNIKSWNTRATMDKADMARKLQQLIQTEGLDSAYVWLGEVATGDEPEFSRPGNEIYET